MRTINLYLFHELPKEARDRVIEEAKVARAKKGYENMYLNEQKTSAKKFMEELNISDKVNTKIDCYLDYITCQHNKPKTWELSGLRARTWLMNNVYYLLYKRKTYNRRNKTRQSQIFVSYNYCPLTKFEYDEVILKPIRDFILNPTDETIEDIFYNCLHALDQSIKKEEEYYYSIRGIENSILIEDEEFSIPILYTEDGQPVMTEQDYITTFEY